MCLFRHQVILLFAAMWILFSLSGCAKAPDEELAAAKLQSRQLRIQVQINS